MNQIIQDFRVGFRILWKAPALSATAVFLIALVIGGNTSIYSMVHALITKPAPGVTADHLVALGFMRDRAEGFHSFPDYVEYASQTRTLDPLIAFSAARFTLTLDEGSYALLGAQVTSNFFDGLGVRLVRGRSFSGDESRLDATGLVAVISHRVWQERFDESEDVIGRGITLNGFPATIIGVAPPQFHGAALASPEDVWVPISSFSRINGKERGLSDRRSPAFDVVMIGRLKTGVGISEAQAEFTTLSARMEAAYPETNKDTAIQVHPYAATIYAGIWVESSRFLAIFSVVTAITLVIVCANVANLLLARAVKRQRETAVRQSLGAPRIRILRMLFAEGLAISVTAWGVACVVAYWISRMVPLIVGPPEMNPMGQRPNHMSMDFSPGWQVMLYAMILAIAGTLVFTLAPALQTWKLSLLPNLKAGESGVAPGRSKLSSVLVVAQFAFSILLLTSSGLAYRSLSIIETMDFGFNKDNLLLVTVNPTLSVTNRQMNIELFARSQERLQKLPGVTSVSYIRILPPRSWSREPLKNPGSPEPVFARTNFVGPDFLRTLGLSAVAGREFSSEDRSRANRYAIINKSLAEELWPGQNAIGQIAQLGQRQQPLEVIGVAPDAFYAGAERDPRPNFLFMAEQQDPAPPTGEASFRESGAITFYVRYTGRMEPLIRLFGAAIREVDSRIPIVSTRTMDTQLTGSPEAQIATILLTIFSSISLTIAAIGQYAVIAFDMGRRKREFGVRIAMGASSRHILTSVIAQGLQWTAAGLVIGFGLSVAVGTVLSSVLFGVTPTDAPTYLGVFALLSAASLLACYLPARRASRIDPLEALRAE